MPHIKEVDRAQYQLSLTALRYQLTGKPRSHLVYVLYALVRSYLTWQSPPNAMPTWEQRSDACNALHDAECEFRRLWINDYEDSKIKENGEAK